MTPRLRIERMKTGMKSKMDENKRMSARIVCLAISACIIFPAFAEAEIVNRLMARVNGEPVTYRDFQVGLFELLKARKMDLAAYNELAPKEKREIQRRIMDGLIDSKLILTNARAMEIQVAPEDLTRTIASIMKENNIPDRETFRKAVEADGFTWDKFKERISNQLLMHKFQRQTMTIRPIKVTPREIRDYFKRNSEAYKKPEAVRIAQIALPVSEEDSFGEAQARRLAEDIRGRLEAGGSFADLAMEHSKGPGADKGGDIGFLELQKIREEFRDVITGKPEGYISEPVRLSFGYVIVKVVEWRKEGTASLDEVSDQIEARIRLDRRKQERRIWLQRLREDAFIEIKYDDDK